MRLTEMEPHWIKPGNWAEQSPPFYIGVSFFCPHCSPQAPESGPNRRRRLAVNFWPPIDPEKLLGRVFEMPPQGNPVYTRTGDTFDTLTLSPSIAFDGSIGHWHGNIINGDCKP